MSSASSGDEFRAAGLESWILDPDASSSGAAVSLPSARVYPSVTFLIVVRLLFSWWSSFSGEECDKVTFVHIHFSMMWHVAHQPPFPLDHWHQISLVDFGPGVHLSHRWCVVQSGECLLRVGGRATQTARRVGFRRKQSSVVARPAVLARC